MGATYRTCYSYCRPPPTLITLASDVPQVIPDLTATKFEWDTVEIDNLAEWSIVSHTFTPTYDGDYEFNGCVRSESTNWVISDVASLIIVVDGVETKYGGCVVENNGKFELVVRIHAILSLTAGQVVEIHIYHSEGGDTSFGGNPMCCVFTIQKLHESWVV